LIWGDPYGFPPNLPQSREGNQSNLPQSREGNQSNLPQSREGNESSLPQSREGQSMVVTQARPCRETRVGGHQRTIEHGDGATLGSGEHQQRERPEDGQ